MRKRPFACDDRRQVECARRSDALSHRYGVGDYCLRRAWGLVGSANGFNCVARKAVDELHLHPHTPGNPGDI